MRRVMPNFENADLRGANRSGAKLHRANLSDADLRGIGNNIRMADLRDTALFGTDLRCVHFYAASGGKSQLTSSPHGVSGYDLADISAASR
jgi:uncharacterized protein YjbI with pentapeptide repeats